MRPVAGLGDQQRQIQFANIQPPNQIGAAAIAHVDLYRRITPGELGDHAGQNPGTNVIRGTESNRAPHLGRQELPHGFIVELQQLSGIAQHDLALGGEMHLAGLAHEQRPTEHFFQSLDLHADGGGRAKYLLRGPGEAARLGDGHEGPQDFHIQNGQPLGRIHGVDRAHHDHRSANGNGSTFLIAKFILFRLPEQILALTLSPSVDTSLLT